jgi:hypothetical protein
MNFRSNYLTAEYVHEYVAVEEATENPAPKVCDVPRPNLAGPGGN